MPLIMNGVNIPEQEGALIYNGVKLRKVQVIRGTNQTVVWEVIDNVLVGRKRDMLLFISGNAAMLVSTSGSNTRITYNPGSQNIMFSYTVQ